jgi:uncharacterized Ntn-hydrolase superfamily protein
MDSAATLRQVATVSADGSVAATTGDLCIDHAGEVVADGFIALANMAASGDVWLAMAAAFGEATGPLARRLLAGLAAGEAAGGDARGRRSAALLVVQGTVSGADGRGASLCGSLPARFLG